MQLFDLPPASSPRIPSSPKHVDPLPKAPRILRCILFLSMSILKTAPSGGKSGECCSDSLRRSGMCGFWWNIFRHGNGQKLVRKEVKFERRP